MWRVGELDSLCFLIWVNTNLATQGEVSNRCGCIRANSGYACGVGQGQAGTQYRTLELGYLTAVSRNDGMTMRALGVERGQIANDEAEMVRLLPRPIVQPPELTRDSSICCA